MRSQDEDMFVSWVSFARQGSGGPDIEASIKGVEDVHAWLEVFCNTPDSSLSFCSANDECIDVFSNGSRFFLAGFRKPIGSFVGLKAPHNGRTCEVYSSGDYTEVPENGGISRDAMLEIVVNFCMSGHLTGGLVWTPFGSL